MRYRQLIELVRKKQPRAILEIGTWRGKRAREMLDAAPGATYYGFDLFEEATEETDRIEFNVKPHFSMKEVLAYIGNENVVLVKGNTRETLPKYRGKIKADFVFIDGGHSEETIRSDWENVQLMLNPGAVVVFDDYYTGVPTPSVGCNSIVRSIGGITLLSEKDSVKGGGFVQLAVYSAAGED